MSRSKDEQWFSVFADRARWRFAKTYVESYPHEYTLTEWCDDADFEKAIRCIEQWGRPERFWSAERKYLYVADRKYWHMGDPQSEDQDDRPGLINRAWIDVSMFGEEARRLGYDEESVKRLVSRWRRLLKRAGQGSTRSRSLG